MIFLISTDSILQPIGCDTVRRELTELQDYLRFHVRRGPSRHFGAFSSHRGTDGQDHWHAAAVLSVFPVQANQVALLELNCDQNVRGRLYLLLSPAAEIAEPLILAPMRSRIAPQTKRVVAKLTALFSLDAFGGGFLTDALVAYWFFRRFGVAEHELGLVSSPCIS
jgi:hypothetical protein